MTADTAFYTIPDVAALLKVSVRTVRRLIEKHQIPHHRIGGQYRISQVDFKTFVAGQRTNGSY